MDTLFRSFLKHSYRFLQSRVVEKRLLPFWFSETRLNDGSQNSILSSPTRFDPSGSQPSSVWWFHAASVGELESLWSLILAAAETQRELILTVLSESAWGALHRLEKVLLEKKPNILFCGYSPWEGSWGDAFEKLRPSLFITAKYEAWPDLWMCLKERNIPLAIIGARARKSLRIAKQFCQLLEGGLPQLYLFPVTDFDFPQLKQMFPVASIEVSGEPRWDRVFSRSQAGNPRSKHLLELFQGMPRPWGIIGSAWIEDLEAFKSGWNQVKGTLWIVPHQLRTENLRKIESFLTELHFNWVRTSVYDPSSQDQSDIRCIIVDEMGFLSELYSVMDWAFVGGGFGAGVHSTIEPAIYGMPIGVGPHGTDKFSEVRELALSGQLTILQQESDFIRWVNQVNFPSEDKKKTWVDQAQVRRGATQKILMALEKFQGPC